MAQKSKAPAAKQSGKATGKNGDKVKSAEKLAKTVVKTDAKHLVKAVAPKKGTPANTESKPPKATKSAPPPMKLSAAAEKEKGSPEIAQAKAALKKQSVSAYPSVKSAASPVKEPKARARKIAIDINPNEAASALAQKWTTLYKKAEQIEAKPYNMKAIFQEKTAIVHKVLGWGYILANRNDRLEVLFKDGIKYLISNYKP